MTHRSLVKVVIVRAIEEGRRTLGLQVKRILGLEAVESAASFCGLALPRKAIIVALHRGVK